MNKQILKGEWSTIKGRVKGAWGELTDDDLARADGDWDRLVGAIQTRTGKVREDIERTLSSLLDKITDETAKVSEGGDKR